MIIRKISIGSDYKSSAMHYIIGQDVLGGSHKIHHMRLEEAGIIKIWIESSGEILLWKEFNNNMPVSIEYNINF